MLWNVAEKFRDWCSLEEEARPIRLFRIAFTGIWLTYDLLDFFLRGTASGAWMFHDSGESQLKLVQIGLILAQGLLIFEYSPCLMAFLCFLLRFCQAWFFLSLNDFYYYSVIMLILSQAKTENGKSPIWVRDVLVWQAAWIYFATGMLKLNPEWLSGGHLFVRIQYLASVFRWPYPEFFQQWTSVLMHDAWLSYLGACLELTLAFMLLLRAPKRITLATAIALHGFAALAVNVWFFGAAMIAQVWLSGRPLRHDGSYWLRHRPLGRGKQELKAP